MRCIEIGINIGYQAVHHDKLQHEMCCDKIYL